MGDVLKALTLQSMRERLEGTQRTIRKQENESR